MIKAIIFDFDGLIIDTETAWYDAYKEVLKEEFQFDLPIERFAKCVGSHDTILFSYLETAIGQKVDADDLREKTGKLHSKTIEKTAAREGVIDYLKEAKKLGLKISLATSSKRSWAVTHLTNLGLLSYFDHLVTQDDVEHVKPAPDLFLKALEVLNVEPHETFIFEDSLNGLIAAQKANISTVIVPNPVTEFLPFENYHMRLTSMADSSLSDIVASFNN